MKAIPGSKRFRYVAKVSVFLITVALIAGMVGCDGGASHSLTITSTSGGSVAEPGEGTFTYAEGTVVDLVAAVEETEEGYGFVEWTGDVDTITNVNAATTTITMNDNYTITANFVQRIPVQDWYDLDAIRYNLSGDYFLMNDLNSTTAGYEELASPTANSEMGWEPIGTEDDPFTGTFGGQGYKIADLFIYRPDEDTAGLFGYSGEGGRIKDIDVVNATVTGDTGVGSLVGQNAGTVNNSYSTGGVTGEADVGGLVGENNGSVLNSHSTSFVVGVILCAGGLVGFNFGGTVSDSYSNSNVDGDSYVGGLVGDNWAGTVDNCYSTGAVTGNSGVGGLVGSNFDTISRSYSTGSVTGQYGIGGLVGGNGGECPGIVEYCYASGSVTGEYGVGGLIGVNVEGTVIDSYSTGNVAGDYAAGGLVGTSDRGTAINSFYNYDEILINGQHVITIGALFGEDFDQWLADGKFLDVNERLSQESGYYIINDINDFKQLLAFGQDSSLKYRLSDHLDFAAEPGLYIPYLAGEFDGNGCKISNLSFNFDFVSQVGLFGWLTPSAEITHLAVENINITGASFVGGLVGRNVEGTMSDSHATGNVEGDRYVGGLVGDNHYGTLSNSYYIGYVTGDTYVGGLVGNNHDGTLSNSHSNGYVTGSYYVGGLTGDNTGNVSNSHTTGDVIGDEEVGGLFGYNYMGTVSNSYSTGSVTGESYVGGLVGHNLKGTMSNCYATGNVDGNILVGGLVGWNIGEEASIDSSYSTGSVSGEGCVGGLVGDNTDGTVSNSYATGTVIGDWIYVGGLVGKNYGTVNNSYSAGSVSGNESVGGLVGYNPGGTVSNSFWDIETSGQATSDGGTGKTTAKMQDIATFSGVAWDIIAVANPSTRNPAHIWNIVEDVTYPFLSWQP